MDFNAIWYVGDAIQVDLDAIIFDPVVSTILKMLRFKIVRQALLSKIKLT